MSSCHSIMSVCHSIMSSCHSIVSVCLSIMSSCHSSIFNYIFLSFSYVRLSFNYVFLSFGFVRLLFNYVCLTFNLSANYGVRSPPKIYDFYFKSRGSYSWGYKEYNAITMHTSLSQWHQLAHKIY